MMNFGGINTKPRGLQMHLTNSARQGSECRRVFGEGSNVFVGFIACMMMFNEKAPGLGCIGGPSFPLGCDLLDCYTKSILTTILLPGNHCLGN